MSQICRNHIKCCSATHEKDQLETSPVIEQFITFKRVSTKRLKSSLLSSQICQPDPRADSIPNASESILLAQNSLSCQPSSTTESLHYVYTSSCRRQTSIEHMKLLMMDHIFHALKPVSFVGVCSGGGAETASSQSFCVGDTLDHENLSLRLSGAWTG